ncbi:hypothetical protein N665_1026s0005 [Sinapis alba]|nr:hypothetical protein N665_1026s0005 [Sinapis alba]
MDLQLKQWRSQQQNESEEQSSATKISNFFLDQIQSQTASSAAALPLFVPEPTSSPSISCFSPNTSSSRFLKMGNFFSLAQWQELELQALIYRYMLAGASVPQELLLPIKKSLFQSPLNFFHNPQQQNFPHHQPWYLGRGAMDPEPGRCKRTDGKKWKKKKKNQILQPLPLKTHFIKKNNNNLKLLIRPKKIKLLIYLFI